VSYDHLSSCTSCQQLREVEQAVHASSVNISTGWQPLLDDYAVHSWRNVVRFLNPPDSQRVVLQPQQTSELRFGCPCSIIHAAGSFRLYHTAGTVAGNSSRYPDWPLDYVFSSSTDGVSRWSKPKRVQLDGWAAGVTGSFTASVERTPVAHGKNTSGTSPMFVAGYEGSNSKACLAHSLDGVRWSTIPTHERTEEWLTAAQLKRIAQLPKLRPAHLISSFIDGLHDREARVNLKTGAYASPCAPDVKHCRKAGAVFGNGQKLARGKTSVWMCVQAMHHNRTLSAACANATGFGLYSKIMRRDCVDTTASGLGRAADCNIQPIFDASRRRQLVWYRRDFGTQGGWREIRGAQVVEMKRRLRDQSARPVAVVPVARRLSSYYLDRLGKLERFRRQIYSLTFTRYSDSLWLGLMTVIEWGKDLAEGEGDALPSFERDTTSIYLVTSRDGVHVNDEWVYARRPLVLKGKAQRDWDSGFQLAANHIMADKAKAHWRVYFEARRHRHEERFREPGVIGMASWRLGTLVGVRVADATVGAGTLVTKHFSLRSERLGLQLNVDASGRRCGNGSVLVELLGEAEQGPVVLASSINITKRALAVSVPWRTGRPPALPQVSVSVVPGARLRLRFTLTGSARLFAFRVNPGGSTGVVAAGGVAPEADR